MEQFKNMRFEPQTEEESKAIEKQLINLGYRLESCSGDKYIIAYEHGAFYFFNFYWGCHPLHTLADISTPKRGDTVWVMDVAPEKWASRIFLAEIKGANYPYIVVDPSDEGKFLSGDKFEYYSYKQMRTTDPSKDIPEYTWSEIKEMLQEKLGHEFKIKGDGSEQ